MADTQRSLSTLQTLLADNITGNISPQDLRDVLISLQPPFGGLYFSTPAATTISNNTDYFKAAGTTTSTSLTKFTMPANNRLTYTGVSPRHIHIACSVSMTADDNNQIIEPGIYHWDDSLGSGSVLESSKLQRKISTGADLGSTALHTDVMMDTNDYLELHIKNTTSGTNGTINLGYLFAMGMII